MHPEMIRLPRGQKLIRAEETVSGETIALARVSSHLHAVYWVSPGGHVEDPAFAGTRRKANGLFQDRLIGSC